MVNLPEPEALVEAVRNNLVSFREDRHLEFLLLRSVGAHGRDVHSRVDPFGPHERLPGRRRRDHDVGTSHCLFDGLGRSDT